MTLTKAAREALPADAFAVPGKRAFPLTDERHIMMARAQLPRASGLTDNERSAARARIAARASDVGIDTSAWDTIGTIRLSAMALDMPDIADHPNKMPFSGVMVRLDEPSDAAPHGSKGKLVVMSKAAAEKALSSLLAMAVDYTPDFDGHDPQRKLGVITGATIEGSDLCVEGFIYAADFPEEAAEIKANKNALGFSFEAQQIHVESLDTDPLVITDCVFTGAAILLKDKAAFTSTSIAAAADTGDFNMTDEELKAILAGALQPITDKIATIEANQVELGNKIEAGKELHAKVAPFADRLRKVATDMSAAGVGTHSQRGHAAILNRAADTMEAEAMSGTMPHIFRDHDYGAGFYAAADKDSEKGDVNAAISAAVVAATRPLKEQIGSLETKLGDKIAASREGATEPDRKTLSPAITSLLARADITVPGDGEKLSVAKLDESLKASGLGISQRLAVKQELSRAGVLP